MEHSSRRIQRLQFILNIQRIKNIGRKFYREMGTVRIIWGIPLPACCPDISPPLPVMLRQAVCGGLCRSRLKVVEISVLLLIHNQTLPHMVEHFLSKSLRLRMCQVFPEPHGIQPHFIHANQTNGRKMTVKASQITFRIRIQSFVQKLADNIPFNFQGTCGNIHHMIQPLIKFLLILGKVGNPRQVNRNYAHAPRTLPGTKESPCLFAQLPQIQAQAAAHAAYIAWLHVTVDIVGKIRRPVF